MTSLQFHQREGEVPPATRHGLEACNCNAVVWLVQLARVSVKTVMDVGRGDGRVAGGNSELMEIADDVPGGI
jgi:hypothetical protein